MRLEKSMIENAKEPQASEARKQRSNQSYLVFAIFISVFLLLLVLRGEILL